jgi:cytidylate kinase
LIKDGVVKEAELEQHLNQIKIEFRFNPNLQKSETFLNGENVENTIRNLEVSNHVSQVSSIGTVREQLVRLQQEMGKEKGIVMDGRDIGTTVFPKAELKIYMTSSVEVRAERRYKELIEKGQSVGLKEIEDNIRMRDHIDTTRDISPLKKADDAIELDNSYLTQEEQFEWILERISEKVALVS